jgi:hypothetical protein
MSSTVLRAIFDPSGDEHLILSVNEAATPNHTLFPIAQLRIL